MHENDPISKPRRDLALFRFQRSRRSVFDGIALLIYLNIVYVWSLGLPPLGRDFEMLAGGGEGLAFFSRYYWKIEVVLFGDNVFGYHAVNLLLLYGCMLALYWLARSVFSGRPIWLATLTATLFMANPIHSDGVLHLSSVFDLLPALVALVSLACYVEHLRNPSSSEFKATLAILGVGTLLFPSNIGLPAVALLFDGIRFGVKSKGFVVRAAGLIALTAVALFVQREHLALSGLDFAGMFAPLYFVLYAIGFLPETAYLFHTHPWVGWLAAAAVVAVLCLVWRKSRYPIFLFGLGGAACTRLFQADAVVDPVHLVGGGKLLLPSALLTLALVSVFARMMDHPKWRRSTISGTTLLAVAFFGLQIAEVSAWRHAGRQVESFQAEAMAWRNGQEDGFSGVLGVMPDFTYYRGAPMMLSESIRFDTPFSEAIPHRSILKLHYDLPGRLDVQWERRGSDALIVNVTHNEQGPRAALIWPYTLGAVGGVEEYGGLTARTESMTEDTLTVVIVSETGDLPEAITP